MSTYNRKTFHSLIFSNEPSKIEEGMSLLRSIYPPSMDAVFDEIGWTLPDENTMHERLAEHPYLVLYLLGLMHEYNVSWVVELEFLEICDDPPLTEVPSIVGNLTQLRHVLFECSSFLESLPDSMANLTNLIDLNMFDCPRMKRLPNNLSALGVDKPLLERFEEQVYKMTTLKRLDLSIAELTAVPASLGNLTNLEWLALGGTLRNGIPECIGNLTKLRHLSIGDSQLTSLPDSIGNLRELDTLRLSNNQLTAVPASLDKLTALKELSLRGNPIPKEQHDAIKARFSGCRVTL